jgi:hypothetical protein
MKNAGACMSPTLCYIAIGSNLASPLEQVKAALDAIGEIPQSRVVAVSSFYRTPPLGPQDQPDYLNAAVALETTLEAEALLDHTQRIELQQGACAKPSAGAAHAGPGYHAVWRSGYSDAASHRSPLRHEKSRLYAVAVI